MVCWEEVAVAAVRRVGDALCAGLVPRNLIWLQPVHRLVKKLGAVVVLVVARVLNQMEGFQIDYERASNCNQIVAAVARLPNSTIGIHNQYPLMATVVHAMATVAAKHNQIAPDEVTTKNNRVPCCFSVTLGLRIVSQDCAKFFVAMVALTVARATNSTKRIPPF